MYNPLKSINYVRELKKEKISEINYIANGANKHSYKDTLRFLDKYSCNLGKINNKNAVKSLVVVLVFCVLIPFTVSHYITVNRIYWFLYGLLAGQFLFQCSNLLFNMIAVNRYCREQMASIIEEYKHMK